LLFGISTGIVADVTRLSLWVIKYLLATLLTLKRVKQFLFSHSKYRGTSKHKKLVMKRVISEEVFLGCLKYHVHICSKLAVLSPSVMKLVSRVTDTISPLCIHFMHFVQRTHNKLSAF